MDRRSFIKTIGVFGFSVLGGKLLGGDEPEPTPVLRPLGPAPELADLMDAETLQRAQERVPRYTPIGFNALVQPHATCIIEAEAARAVQSIRRLVTAEADAFTIDTFDVRQGHAEPWVAMFVAAAAVPARVFDADSAAVHLRSDPVQQGGAIRLTITNHTEAEATFRGVIIADV